ncbi:hypothetical protein HAX54_015826 [Datura stramonium]|uniref:Uncharacterized protein n=1 Tax=Datura stramonium TaxID=4076 RepID=A0ABS8UHU1_DATST|nr:hypothetical protein [Datura stramonium]
MSNVTLGSKSTDKSQSPPNEELEIEFGVEINSVRSESELCRIMWSNPNSSFWDKYDGNSEVIGDENGAMESGKNFVSSIFSRFRGVGGNEKGVKTSSLVVMLKLSTLWFGSELNITISCSCFLLCFWRFWLPSEKISDSATLQLCLPLYVTSKIVEFPSDLWTCFVAKQPCVFL